MRLKHFLSVFLTLLALSVGQMWGAAGDEITSVANIVSGKTYYIKGVRSSTTYYLTFTDATGSQSGTESSTTAGAVPITFTSVTGGYNLTTPNGYYIAPGTSNGKINVSSSAITVSAGNQNSKIRLSIKSGNNTWAIQKNTSAANFGGYKLSGSDITLIEASSCDPLTMSTVTATPGNTQIALSWPAVSHADSYTVSCKEKSSGTAAGTAGTVTGSTTKSCTITGLQNGIEYTWSVEPVGSGTYCASNTPATGNATPNTTRTITYYDKDGSHTTTLTDGTNIATALNALYGVGGPISCNTDDYEYFVGWKDGSINGYATSVTLLKSEVVNSTTAANTYYAVWANKELAVTDYTFTSATWSATSGSSSANWTNGSGGNAYTAGQGNQITQNKSGANATSPVSFTNVSEVVVTYNTNQSAGAGAVKIKIGDNDEVSNNVAYGGSGDGKSANYTTSFDFEPKQTGNVKLTVTCTTNSIWLKAISIKTIPANTKFITTCCSPLGQINGSFFWTTHFCPAWPEKH